MNTKENAVVSISGNVITLNCKKEVRRALTRKILEEAGVKVSFSFGNKNELPYTITVKDKKRKVCACDRFHANTDNHCVYYIFGFRHNNKTIYTTYAKIIYAWFHTEGVPEGMDVGFINKDLDTFDKYSNDNLVLRTRKESIQLRSKANNQYNKAKPKC